MTVHQTIKKQKPLIVANWKMHGSYAKIESLLKDLVAGSKGKGLEEVQIVICPPAPYLECVRSQLKNSFFQWGAQNAYCEKEGAFTGEISPSMLIDFGCQFVILGHSERRQYFSETDALIARKCVAAYDAGLIPILCVGETAAERQANRTFEVIDAQLGKVLDAFASRSSEEHSGQSGQPEHSGQPEQSALAQKHDFVIAYEPVWAIGTGLTATPEEADKVHAFIREIVVKRAAALAKNLRILYGGSVKAANALSLFSQPHIDGGLVGGASLIAEEFLGICWAAKESI